MYSNGIATRDKIIAEAKALFYAKGYRATTYREICAAADVNPGTLAHHFGGKAGLANEIARGTVGQITRIAEERYAEEPGLVRVLVATVLYFDLLFDDGAFRRFFAECTIDAGGEGLPAELAIDSSVTADALEEAVGLERTSVIMPIVHGMDSAFEGLVLERGDELDRDQAVTLYLSMAYAPLPRADELVARALELAGGLTLRFAPDFGVVEA